MVHFMLKIELLQNTDMLGSLQLVEVRSHTEDVCLIPFTMFADLRWHFSHFLQFTNYK